MKTGSMVLPFLRVGGRFSAHSHLEGCAEKLASKPVSDEFKELQVHAADHILKGFLSLQALCFPPPVLQSHENPAVDPR
ncbi:hypothetical protein AB9K35_08385 [Leisingera sp. XS_AS12]